MQPAEQGRYCAHCSKVVTDFTSKTEQEIADFFKHKPQQVCGRFRHEQLQKTYTAPVQMLPAHRRMARYLLGILLTGAAAEKAKAQEPVSTVLQKDSLSKDSAFALTPPVQPDSLALCDDDTTQAARAADSLLAEPVKIKWDWQPGICVPTATYVISTEIMISGAISLAPPEQKNPLDYLLDSLELMFSKLRLKRAAHNAHPAAALVNDPGKNNPRKAPLQLPSQEAVIPPATVWRPKRSGRTKPA